MPTSRRLLLLAAALAAVAVGLPWSSHRVAFDIPIGLNPSTGDGRVWVWGAVHQDTGLTHVVLGTQHPVRVLAVVGVLGVWSALRHGSRWRALAALALAAVALPLGPWEGGLQPGRICYLLALLTAVVAIAMTRAVPSAASRYRRTAMPPSVK